MCRSSQNATWYSKDKSVKKKIFRKILGASN